MSDATTEPKDETQSSQGKKHEFQAEVNQLLRLMAHSLYSNKEIFLRELISNAADATERLRFEAVTDGSLLSDDPNLRIRLIADSEAGTLTISDNGIGMSEEDVIANLGTIARSGTRHFLESLEEGKAKDQSMIGQFGVGFYSAFIVADRVTVNTRRAGVDQAVRWESNGDGSFEVTPIEKESRGTDIVLHIREEEKEFLESFRLRSIIKRYSDHVATPIELPIEQFEAADEDGEKADNETSDADKPVEYEVVNRAEALWRRSKNDISDEEHAEFFKQLSFDQQPPLATIHNRVEGKLEYTSLLYIPETAPFDLWDRDAARGLKLYVQRVFIMDDAEHLLPTYLRFIKGVIDSNDLPLNVSRELLQGDKTIDSIRAATIKRVLDRLESMADKEPENYGKFWASFGAVIKEGIVEDFSNRERIAGLCRFSSTKADSDEQSVGLDAYIERMPEGQEEIYYLTAENLTTAKSSPHLEAFRASDREVLLMTDRIDEWMVGNLFEYKGKKLVSVAKGEIDLGQDEKAEGENARLSKLYEDVVAKIGSTLGDQVESVRVSKRLKESPACLVVGDNAMSRHLEALLKQAGQDAPSSKPILEVNPQHPLLERMRENPGDDFDDLANLLYEQSVLAEGAQLNDPAAFVQRLNRLVLSQKNS